MKIIQQTKKGKNIIIRYPEMSDLENMLTYINSISDERTFITKQGEHETIESEKKYIEGMIKAIRNQEAVQLLAFYNNKLVGVCDIHMDKKTGKHIGTLGITVIKEFRGEGVGKILMKLIEEEAVKNIPNLRIIILQVFAQNNIAIDLYKKSGFVQYGLLPRGIYRNESFEDEILMYKNVR